MNKSEAVRIISKCANIYKKRLDGYQIVLYIAMKTIIPIIWK